MINMILPPSRAGMGSRLVNPRATEIVPMNESTLTAGKLTGEDSALASYFLLPDRYQRSLSDRQHEPGQRNRSLDKTAR